MHSRALLLTSSVRLGLIKTVEDSAAQDLSKFGSEDRELFHLEEGWKAVDVNIGRAEGQGTVS